jgi:hypothetical protein
MSVINQNLLMTPEGYQISRSVRLRSSASAYLNRTPTSVTDGKKWTWSAWVKRGVLSSNQGVFDGYYNASNFTSLFFYNDKLYFYSITGGDFVTTAVFRDPSAWYHIVLTYDSANATSADRVIIYVNGVRQAGTLTAAPSLNAVTYINNTSASQRLGIRSDVPWYFDGYVTETNFIDGQALTPSSFGETDAVTGVWKPKKYAGTYGTNGFYLNFADNSAATAAAIGKDSSGNGNNWTPNNISVTAGVTYDSMLDVPTMYADGGNGRGNYAVLNPLDKYSSTIGTSEANTKLISTSGGSFQQLRNTIGMSSGKYYMEWVISSIGASGRTGAALIRHDSSLAGASTSTTTSWCYSSTGDAYANNVTTALSTGAITTGTDIVMYAFDADSGKFWMGKNGVWANSGDPATGANPIYSSLTSGPYFFGGWNYNTSDVVAFNFGQRPFAYTPPTGFKALNTQNLPDATIKKGNAYFNTALYTGNGGNQSITGVGFQPDLVWGKLRSASGNHRLSDSVRGADNTLSSNLTDAEVAGNGLVSFDADGFTMDSGTNINQVYPYVAWNWKESVSAGFDIVTYTGTGGGAARTIAHSLGATPKLMINKGRSAGTTGTDHWVVYHGNFSAGDYILLSATNAKANSSNYWGNTAPTSSNFYVGGGAANVGNENGIGYVAYLFAEVAGFSKFGSYTGNGSADGPFVYCGFRPRFIMVKRTDSSTYGNWEMIDTARDSYNQAYLDLSANLSAAENATDGASWDILSNGFKCRDGSSTGNKNVSGGTYIYAAFAENPFKNSLAR